MITELFDKPKIIAIVGDVNNGKSNLLYYTLTELNKKGDFNLYTYGLRLLFPNAKQIFSVSELEQIKDSIIIVDELSSLFDLDNRKIKKQVENSLRLINHNNNILVVCGTPENFKKFISAKVDVIIYKKTTFADCVNGSRVKDLVMNYKGNQRGSEMLNLSVGEAVLFDGKHYSLMDIPYMKQYDSKKENKEIIRKRKSKIRH